MEISDCLVHHELEFELYPRHNKKVLACFSQDVCSVVHVLRNSLSVMEGMKFRGAGQDRETSRGYIWLESRQDRVVSGTRKVAGDGLTNNWIKDKY